MSTRTLPLRSFAAVTLLLGTALLAGCSGTGTVDASDVETEAAAQLAATVDNGTTPDISCPEDLDAEVDATVTCDLTVEGDDTVYPVTITVTSVDGDNVKFDVQVADEPKS